MQYILECFCHIINSISLQQHYKVMTFGISSFVYINDDCINLMCHWLSEICYILVEVGRMAYNLKNHIWQTKSCQLYSDRSWELDANLKGEERETVAFKNTGKNAVTILCDRVYSPKWKVCTFFTGDSEPRWQLSYKSQLPINCKEVRFIN